VQAAQGSHGSKNTEDQIIQCGTYVAVDIMYVYTVKACYDGIFSKGDLYKGSAHF
jgi:hypothetical protein